MKPPSPSRTHAAEAVLDALRASARGLRWLVIVFALVYLASGLQVIGPDENAVVLRLGRAVPPVRPPGLVLAWPAPFEEVVRLPALAQRELALDDWAAPSGAPGTMAPLQRLHPARDGYTLTGDANIVQGRFTLRYRVADPLAWFHAGPAAERLLEAAAYRALAGTLATLGIDAVLTSGQREWRERALAATQSEADRLALGAQVSALEIRELIPARQVAAAFAAVADAQLDAATQVESARGYAGTQLPAAQAEAYKIRSEADSDARQLLALAAGESSSFLALLAEDRRAPLLLRARLRDETLAAVLPLVGTQTVAPGASLRLLLQPTEISPR